MFSEKIVKKQGEIVRVKMESIWMWWPVPVIPALG
jgi:hypothetical protein